MKRYNTYYQIYHEPTRTKEEWERELVIWEHSVIHGFNEYEKQEAKEMVERIKKNLENF